MFLISFFGAQSLGARNDEQKIQFPMEHAELFGILHIFYRVGEYPSTAPCLLFFVIFSLNLPSKTLEKKVPPNSQESFKPKRFEVLKIWGVNLKTGNVRCLTNRNDIFFLPDLGGWLVGNHGHHHPVEVCQPGSSPCSWDSCDVSRGGGWWPGDVRFWPIFFELHKIGWSFL